MKKLFMLVALVGFFGCEDRKSEPQQIIVVSKDYPTPLPTIPSFPDTPPTKATMPEPIVIKSWVEAGRISDANLRSFARRKANFKTDQVLYFEWKGGPGDLLTGDLVSKDKKYTITLHPNPVAANQEIMHRQVFVVPLSYSYHVEMAK